MFVAPLTSPLPYERLPKHTHDFNASKRNQQEASLKAAFESKAPCNDLDRPKPKTRRQSWLLMWLHKHHMSSDSLWSRTRHRRSDSQSTDERTYYELARGRAV